jgi:AcrR family transcriptional regulator
MCIEIERGCLYGCTDECIEKFVTRPYTLRRRAESQAATRQRIVEAAVELHGSIGPALTTLSMIAARAGVQRHTLYAHFPDERSLFLACSGLTLERDAPPDAASWRAIDDRHKRLRAGLTAIYGWYGRNAGLAACVLRDAEVHALTREIADMRLGPYIAGWHAVLGAKLPAKPRAVLALALSYFTWRTLVHESGLKPSAAVDAMVQAVLPARSGAGAPRLVTRRRQGSATARRSRASGL